MNKAAELGSESKSNKGLESYKGQIHNLTTKFKVEIITIETIRSKSKQKKEIYYF
jgi:hypothetical protein